MKEIEVSTINKINNLRNILVLIDSNRKHINGMMRFRVMTRLRNITDDVIPRLIKDVIQ